MCSKPAKAITYMNGNSVREEGKEAQETKRQEIEEVM
jgi:hypothetical protein